MNLSNLSNLSLSTKIGSLSLLSVMLLAACSPSEKQNPPPASSAEKAPASQVAPNHSNETKRVAVTSIVEHISLDSVRHGMIEQLKTEGFEEGKNLKIDYQSAQGNTGTAAQIAKKFAGDKPDAIVAIATPSAQAVVSATKEIPVVYAAITDPIGAKLVPSWEPSGTNVTGTSDQHDMKPELELMKEIVPDLKAIGYVYNAGEVNSVIMLNQLKTEAQGYGWKVVEVQAQHTADVLNAARSLKDKVQVIYTAQDNNVVSAYASMYKAAMEMKIPLIASDPNLVSKGAVAAVGVNYHTLGKETGKMVARILKGEAAGSIASQRATEFELVVSPKHAQEQGVNLSDDLKKRANQVLE